MAEKTKPHFTTNELVTKLKKDLGDFCEIASQLEKPEDVARIKWPKARPQELKKIAQEIRTRHQKARRERGIRFKARTEALEQTIVNRQKKLEAMRKAEPPVVSPEKGKFLVSGRVIDKASGMGLPHVTVRAFDLDRKYSDLLGTVRTDEFGYYRITYSEKDFKDLFDKKPEVYIEVLDQEEGKQIYTSPKSFIHKAGKVEIIDAHVDGTKVPSSLALGRAIKRTMDARIRDYERRKATVAGRRLITSGELAPAEEKKPPATKKKAPKPAKKTVVPERKK
jgi:hypothetical protein